MNIELMIGIALGIYFVAFISYAIYREIQAHKHKAKFDIREDIKK